MGDAHGASTTTSQRVAVVTGGAAAPPPRGGRPPGGLRLAAAAPAPPPPGQAGDPGLPPVPVDVTDAGSVDAMREEVLGRGGRIDVLAKNPGIAGPTTPVADYPP